MPSTRRREVLQTLVAGAALVSAGGATAAPREPRDGSTRGGPPLVPAPSDEALARVRSYAAGPASFRPDPAPSGGSVWAHVLLCRSWESTIYLHAGPDLAGIAVVSERALAIAGACQAAGRPVALRYARHFPRYLRGLGRFEGVHLAVDLADLPGAPPIQA